MPVLRIRLKGTDTLAAAAEREALLKLYRELERFILERAVQELRRRLPSNHEHDGATPMAASKDGFQGLVGTLRAEMQEAVGAARALRHRGAVSLSAFRSSARELHGVYDVVDAVTEEINGALAGDVAGIKGLVGNSGASSQTSDASSAPGAEGGATETRSSSFSEAHPSLRRPPGT